MSWVDTHTVWPIHRAAQGYLQAALFLNRALRQDSLADPAPQLNAHEPQRADKALQPIKT
jgi:hypothetical protein